VHAGPCRLGGGVRGVGVRQQKQQQPQKQTGGQHSLAGTYFGRGGDKAIVCKNIGQNWMKQQQAYSISDTGPQAPVGSFTHTAQSHQRFQASRL
jgi:hypothetical protein